MRYLMIAAAMLIATPAVARDRFGIKQGTPVAKLKIVKAFGKSIYEIRAPLPDESITRYIVRATARDGVCELLVVYRPIGDDASGAKVRSRFAATTNSFMALYGDYGTSDFLDDWSPLRQPQDWALAIYNDGRELAAFWNAEEGSRLPPDLSGISVFVTASSGTETNITILYKMANFAACRKG